MDPAAMEQMNKLRKSLGLAPLTVPGATSTPSDANGPSFKDHHSTDDEDGEAASTLETREAAGFANFQQVQDEERKRLEREKRKAAIQKARDIAARSVKLEGRGLGDAEEDLDAKAWLKGQKKRQKDIEKERARKREEDLAEQERLAALQYTSQDLAGVQVAHEVGDFDDGAGDQILTLQDREIGKDDDDEEDEDVLENADIVAKDKLKEKLDLKKKIAYDVHDTEEKGLLAQYDEKKRKAFTLDSTGAGLAEEREAKRQQVGEKLKNIVSLDILKAEPMSDYQEIKIKKPKKVKKNKRQKEVDDDDIFPVSTSAGADEMEIDGGTTEVKPKVKSSDTVFNDDDDLASALSFTRRAALKKQKRRPEDIIRQIKEEDGEEANSAEAEQGITLDDTTTFLDNLATRPSEEEPAPKVHKSIERDVRSNSPEESKDDQVMTEAYSINENEGEGEEELVNRLQREQQRSNDILAAQTGLDQEQSLSTGLGATLNLLKQRGLMKDTNPSSSSSSDKNPNQDKNKLYRDRQNFILEARLREHDSEVRARLQRERDRTSGKMSHMSVREREEHARWQNTQREHQSSIAAAAAFNKEYKPDVQIKYVDDDGRLMNQKEAFKQLSHQFHGKGSGKGKTEKHLKKLDEEKRREGRSVLDASQEVRRGYEGAAQHQRKGGEAGIRLA